MKKVPGGMRVLSLIIVMAYDRCGAIETLLEYCGGETTYKNIVTSTVSTVKKYNLISRNLNYDELEAKENVH